MLEMKMTFPLSRHTAHIAIDHLETARRHRAEGRRDAMRLEIHNARMAWRQARHEEKILPRCRRPNFAGV